MVTQIEECTDLRVPHRLKNCIIVSKIGQISHESEKHSGRPSTSRNPETSKSRKYES